MRIRNFAGDQGPRQEKHRFYTFEEGNLKVVYTITEVPYLSSTDFPSAAAIIVDRTGKSSINGCVWILALPGL